MQPMLKRLVRGLKYDYDDYETASQPIGTLVTTGWISPSEITTPLTAAIPFTELANRLASAHSFPTVTPLGFEQPLGQELMITNNSSLWPNPPCYHARLVHNQIAAMGRTVRLPVAMEGAVCEVGAIVWLFKNLLLMPARGSLAIRRMVIMAGRFPSS